MPRLLFDQNLSRRLALETARRFLGSLHVRDCGLDKADDLEVWRYATHHDLAIISKDGDFRHLSLAKGHPPKVVWLRAGNCTTTELGDILGASAELIEAFLNNDKEALLVLGAPSRMPPPTPSDER